MVSSRPPILGVIGESNCSEELYRMAEEVGRLAAERGAVVACGGLSGVMEAACRGARAAGGITLGFLPGVDRESANPFVTLPIPTGMGEARNVLVVRAADALVAVGGRFGTLSEIALALKLGKPLVGLRTWGLVHDGKPLKPFSEGDTPEEAVECAFRLLVGGRG
jgi:uncharacterized protein (TIGR00725 family)